MGTRSTTKKSWAVNYRKKTKKLLPPLATTPSPGWTATKTPKPKLYKRKRRNSKKSSIQLPARLPVVKKRKTNYKLYGQQMEKWKKLLLSKLKPRCLTYVQSKHQSNIKTSIFTEMMNSQKFKNYIQDRM